MYWIVIKANTAEEVSRVEEMLEGLKAEKLDCTAETVITNLVQPTDKFKTEGTKSRVCFKNIKH